MKKIKLNWQSVLLGMALCAVLFVFMGSKVAGPQVSGQVGGQPYGALNRPANLDDVYTLAASLDERLTRFEKNFNSYEKDMVAARRHIEVILEIVRTLEKRK